MQNTKRLFILLLIAVLQLAATNAASQEIRIAYDSSPNSPHQPFVDSVRKLAKTELGNQLTFSFVPYRKSINAQKALELLLSGSIDVAIPSLTDMSSSVSRFRLFDLPFLFSNEKSASAFVHGVYGQRLADSVSQVGLKAFGYLDNGMKQIVSAKEIATPFDFVGLSVGTANSEVMQQQYTQVGAEAVSVENRNLRQNILNKTIGAHENNWRGIVDQNLELLQPHVFESNHSYLGFIVVMSANSWQKNQQFQQQIQTVIKRSIEGANRYNNLRMETAKQTIKASSNFKIKEVDVEERRNWVDTFKQVWDIFEEDIGSGLINAAASNR